MNGFKINSVSIVGEQVEDKVVSFKRGINILAGPSNTGKTYLVQCIDYVFGKSDIPKEIDESKGYEKIVLEIEDNENGSKSTILRAINDNKLYFYQNIPYLNIKNTEYQLISGSKSISEFYLKLFGFNLPINISKNASFGKDEFSVRNFTRYMIVEEESMISKHSPIHVGEGFTETTKNRNIFKFLITGVDDSSYQKKEKREIWNAKKAASEELLKELLYQEEEKLQLLQEKIDKNGYFDEEKEDAFIKKIEYCQSQINLLNNELNKVEKKKRKINNEIFYNENLKYKFDLLKAQYLSDIERLNFIDEGAFLLGQLNIVTCPHCGKKIDDPKNHTHEDIGLNIEEMNHACEVEIAKTKQNIAELEKSYETIEELHKELTDELVEMDIKIISLKDELNNVLNPQLTDFKEQWNHQTELKILKSNFVISEENIKNISYMISTNKMKIHITEESTKEQVLEEINDSRFPQILSNNLKKILFEANDELPVVFYLTKKQYEIEFSIAGKNRNSFGKGYKAIMASVFYLSFLMYCKEEKKPHSNLIVLDSPLNAFEEKEQNLDEELSSVPLEKIKSRFFSFLTQNFEDEQVIVIENLDALNYINKQVNALKFTKDSKIGRYGLF